MIDRSGNQVEGYILLSYERPHRLHIGSRWKRQWQTAPRHGQVTNKIKGGLTVDIGVIAFLPSSQVEARPFTTLMDISARNRSQSPEAEQAPRQRGCLAPGLAGTSG